MLAFARKHGFFLLDALKGGVVRNALQMIRRCDHEDFDSEFVRTHQQERVSRLLDHARQTTAFYSGKNWTALEQFPVVNKAVIKENQEAFMSSAYSRDQLFSMHTSGSTGTPFTVYQDARKKKQVNAECIYYSQKVGYDIGKPLCYLRSVVRQVKKSRLKQFMQNQPLIVCNDLSDDGVEAILAQIARSGSGSKTLLAYASTLDAIARHSVRTGTLPRAMKVGGVISGSEMLTDHTRARIEDLFHCQCVSRYSNEENGILGQDDRMNNVFLINEASYLIEILKMDQDEPAAPGECGRIVVTDLYNYAMPMIRYDTGDVGAIEIVEYGGKKRRAISHFIGRRVDAIYSTTGSLVSSHGITNLMWSYPEIRQYQFVQTGQHSYKLKVNSACFTAEEKVTGELKQLLGADAQICIEYVVEIPVLQSGKRKYIVNEYMRNQ